MIDVVENDRSRVCCDPAGKAAAERDANALFDLLLDAAGRARDELVALLVEEQDRARVGGEHLARPIEQRVQQLLELQVTEGCVGQSLESPKTFRVADQIGQGRGIVAETRQNSPSAGLSDRKRRSACSPSWSRTRRRPSPSRST